MSKPSPVDTETHVKTIQTIVRARVHGHDVVEALNRAGLLLTASQERRIRVEVFNYILGRLDDLKPHEFLRRKYKSTLQQRTPNDLYVCMVDWLTDVRNWIRDGGSYEP